MGQVRRRVKHNTTFEERLAEAARFGPAAEEQPVANMARELLMRRAQEAGVTGSQGAK